MTPMKRVVAATLVCVLFGACDTGPEPPNRQPTAPVTGRVLIDGEPAPANVRLIFYNVDEKVTGALKNLSVFTDEEGKFAPQTYDTGDGLPVGDYALTAEWGEYTPGMRATYSGDKFNGRYSNPNESEIKFTVKEDEPLDLGDIELTTQ